MYLITKIARVQKKLQQGSTLIELLIATMIVGTVVTAVAAGVSNSVKNNAEARYRDIATVLAQKGIEVLRAERGKVGWVTFHDSVPVGTYCMDANSSAVASLRVYDPDTCVITESNLDFNRFISLSKTTGSDSEVTAVITVQWERKPGVMSQVTVTQTFKDYTKN